MRHEIEYAANPGDIVARVNRLADVDASRLEHAGDLAQEWRWLGDVFHDHMAAHYIKRLSREGNGTAKRKPTKPIGMFQARVGREIDAPDFAASTAMPFHERIVAAAEVQQLSVQGQMFGHH